MPVKMNVTISFPALDNLVEFLKSRDQEVVDGLTATVKELTVKLKQSSTALQGAVDK